MYVASAAHSNNFYTVVRYDELHLCRSVASFQPAHAAIVVCLYSNSYVFAVVHSEPVVQAMQRIVHLQKSVDCDAALSVKMLTRFGAIRENIMRRPVILRVGAGMKEQPAYNHHHDL